MKEYYGKIQYQDKEYTLACNVNSLQEIQDEYGSIDKWGALTDGVEGEINVKAFIFGIKAMINEGIEIDNEENGTDIPLMTHKQVGRMISELGIENAKSSLDDAVMGAMQSDEKNG